MESKYALTQPDPQRRLLHAALELLTERGYRGATTAEIARRAGVAELTLFRQFGSKASLLTQAVQHAYAPLSEMISAPSGNLEADLLRFAQGYMAYLQNAKIRALLLNAEILRHPELAPEGLPPGLKSFLEQGMELLRHYQKLGQLVDEPVEHIGLAFASPLMIKAMFADTWGIPVPFDLERHVVGFLKGWKKEVAS